MADEVDVINAVVARGEWDGGWRFIAGRWVRTRTWNGITVAVSAPKGSIPPADADYFGSRGGSDG